MCLQLYDQVLLKVNTYVSDKLIICLVITVISKFVFPCTGTLSYRTLSANNLLFGNKINVSFGCIFSFIHVFGHFLGGFPCAEAV